MKHTFMQPDKLLLFFGFIFGIALCILAPFTTGFDEDVQLGRVYDISGFNLMPNTSIYEKSTVGFEEFYTLSQRRLYYRDQSFDLFKPEYFNVRANYESMTIEENSSIYPPLMFFPQAIVAGIGWRFLDLPIIPVSILIRIAGLSLYLVICYLAIKVIPVGKWGLMVIALSPTALYQASTVNGDGYTNAVSFLFISLVASLILNPEHKITKRGLIALCASIFLLGMAKQGAIILFLMVLFLPRKVFSSRYQHAIVWSAVILMTIFHFYWVISVFNRTVVGSESIVTSMGSIVTQLQDYLRVFGRSLATHYQQLFSSMIAAYGYWIGDVPKLVFWIVPLTFLISLVVECKRSNPNLKNRLLMFALMLISWIAILVLYTSGKFQGKDQNTFVLVQGRYLVAFLPLLAIALSCLFRVSPRMNAIFKWGALSGTILTLSLFLWGLFANYYTSCGPYMLSGAACKLPAYQNLDLVNPPQILVKQNSVIEQEFSNSCSRLQSVAVQVKELPAGTSGHIMISLLSENGEVMAGGKYTVDEISPRQLLHLDVADAAGLKKGIYVIKIDTKNMAGTIGLSTRQPDLYPGVLRADNLPVDGDLVFFYYCAPAGFFKY